MQWPFLRANTGPVPTSLRYAPKHRFRVQGWWGLGFGVLGGSGDLERLKVPVGIQVVITIATLFITLVTKSARGTLRLSYRLAAAVFYQFLKGFMLLLRSFERSFASSPEPYKIAGDDTEVIRCSDIAPKP